MFPVSTDADTPGGQASVAVVPKLQQATGRCQGQAGGRRSAALEVLFLRSCACSASAASPTTAGYPLLRPGTPYAQGPLDLAVRLSI